MASSCHWSSTTWLGGCPSAAKEGPAGGPGALPASSDCYRGINSMIAQCGRGRGSKTAASQGACFLPVSATGAPRAPLLRAGNADKAAMLSAVIRTGEKKNQTVESEAAVSLKYLSLLRREPQAFNAGWQVSALTCRRNSRKKPSSWVTLLLVSCLAWWCCVFASLTPSHYHARSFTEAWIPWQPQIPALLIILHKLLAISLYLPSSSSTSINV